MSAAPSYFVQFDNATAQWQIYQMVDALQALDDSAGDRRVNARLLCTVAEGINAHKFAELLALGAALEMEQ